MDINGIKIILFTRVNVIGGGVPLFLPAMTFTASLLIFLAEPPGGAADQMSELASTDVLL